MSAALNNFATHIFLSKKSLVELKKTQTLSINFSPPFTIQNSTKNPSRICHVCPIYAVTEDRQVETSEENEKKGSNGTENIEEKIKNHHLLSILLDKDRFFNAAIVLGAGTLAITKLLTIDHEYWHGWTLYEILRYAPEHNWIAYEEALKANPVLAKMAISGIVYSVGDWIAQCYEGKPLLEFDRTRLFRSGLVGFSLHGSLSHYYYQFCEALFPSNDWWVVPAKVAFDQTIWSAIWNSIYFVVLGFLRLESASNIFGELKTTFWPMLTVWNCFSDLS